ncbi:MAG: transposase [Clostridiales bacterium]|nr:transposase [Clostridiales bacterium]
MLKQYPHIERVTRDGNSNYGEAVAKALPNAIQIYDRFHLLNNLIDALKYDFAIIAPSANPINRRIRRRASLFRMQCPQPTNYISKPC